MSHDALTPKQQLFAQEYLVDLNACAAYKRAGYIATGKSLEANASRLLGKDKVAAYVRELMAERESKVKRNAESVLLDILAVKQDAVQIVTDKDGNRVMADRAAALKALELEGRHYKMFTDKVDTNHSGGITTTLNIAFKRPNDRRD